MLIYESEKIKDSFRKLLKFKLDFLFGFLFLSFRFIY